MENQISPICRFCLEEREEFNHLANDCPALWWERHTINAQVPSHSTPQSWTPQQILDFTMFPRINEAFAKPLYQLEAAALRDQILSQNQHDVDDVSQHNSNSDLSTDVSVMDVSSATDSSSDDDLISVDSHLSD